MPIDSRRPSERSSARVAPLAVLPVFLPLAGKRAVVLGGSEAAVWKAELLAAAGAVVELHAEEPGDGLEHLLAGAAVVVADVRTGKEAAAIRQAPRACGRAAQRDRPAGLVRPPVRLDRQRSPVVVGISTDGAAPVLGQAIRRRIDAILPPSLQAWAGLAQKLRVRLNGRPPRQRWAFWERFVDRAFGAAPTPADETALCREIEGIAAADQPCVGKVTLVGTGPGDAEHLTLKAVRALQSADIVLVDDLVSEGVLEFARREARHILVGKRAGRPSCHQEKINELMLKLARAGQHVVCLKSGGPMIFGEPARRSQRSMPPASRSRSSRASPQA